jgi:hypothetical protein
MQISAQARRGSTGAHEEHGSPTMLEERGTVCRCDYASGKARAVNKVTTLAFTVSGDRTVAVGNVICRDCLPPPSLRERPNKLKRLLTSVVRPFSILLSAAATLSASAVDYESAAWSNRSCARKTPIYAGIKANRYECRRSSSGVQRGCRNDEWCASLCGPRFGEVSHG